MRNLKKIGKILNRNEQKLINGGVGLSPTCEPTYRDCGNAYPCSFGQVCILGQCRC